MATTTTNLELTLPEGTENITRSVLNTNFFLIDEAVGPLPSGETLIEYIDEHTAADAATTTETQAIITEYVRS